MGDEAVKVLKLILTLFRAFMNFFCSVSNLVWINLLRRQEKRLCMHNNEIYKICHTLLTLLKVYLTIIIHFKSFSALCTYGIIEYLSVCKVH